MKTIKGSLVVATVATVGALALPASSLAATSTSLVAGTVGTELSLAVASPAAMAFSHSSPSTASSLVTVTSTQALWTLSIADNNSGANAGRMLKTAGIGPAAVGTPLAGALQWSPNGSTFSDLSASDATVGTGSLVGTKNITFSQALGATENVSAGDAYALTAKYTVN